MSDEAMSPRAKGIKQCFGALFAANVPPPKAFQDANEARQKAAVKSAIATWDVVLHDLHHDEILQVVTLHMARSKWWPTPADLRAIVDGIQGSAAPAIATGDEAWGRALELIGRHGVYQGQPRRLSEQPEEDEALGAAIRAVGGWGRLCAVRLDDMQARASFVRAYEATRERQRQGAETSRMLGDIAPGLMARLGALMREPTRGLPGPAGGGGASEGRPQGERGAGGALPRDGGGE